MSRALPSRTRRLTCTVWSGSSGGDSFQIWLFDQHCALRMKPWDEYTMWKRWIETKSPQGQERMNTIVSVTLPPGP